MNDAEVLSRHRRYCTDRTDLTTEHDVNCPYYWGYAKPVAQQPHEPTGCQINGVPHLGPCSAPMAGYEDLQAEWDQKISDAIDKDVATDDAVDHPSHYNSHPAGIECIDVIEHLPFNVGNAIKYLWRADHKGKQIEDLEKARWYIEREIQRVGPKPPPLPEIPGGDPEVRWSTQYPYADDSRLDAPDDGGFLPRANRKDTDFYSMVLPACENCGIMDRDTFRYNCPNCMERLGSMTPVRFQERSRHPVWLRNSFAPGESGLEVDES